MIDIKKYRENIAVMLFYLCLILAVYNTYGIGNIIQQSVEEQNSELLKSYDDKYYEFNDDKYYEFNIDNLSIQNLFTNLYTIDNTIYDDKSFNMELPLWAAAMWKLVNVVWSLFLGGIIYGNIKRREL